MRIEHVALASRSEEDSHKFFSVLLGLEKVREFVVTEDLMEQFFNVKKEHKVIRYKKDQMEIEVFITNDSSKIKDLFTHICLFVKDKIDLLEKAEEMGYKFIKVPRKEGNDFYLFLKDEFGNLYEIKTQ